MNLYAITLPGVVDPRDLLFSVAPGTIPYPDVVTVDGTTLLLGYTTATLTPAQVSAVQAVADTNPQPASAPWRQSASRRAALANAVVVLRQWAADANATTVTSGNAVSTLQVVVNRFGTLCDRMADLLLEEIAP